MADTAMRVEWPIRQWIGLGLAANGSDRQGREWSAGATIGLHAFTGYELQQAAVPHDVGATATTLYSAAWLPLASGNKYADGHTVGVDGGAEADKLRLRWLPKGATPDPAKVPPLARDTFVMIHPESSFDEAAYFGVTSKGRRRKQIMTQAPRPGFLKRMLGGRQAN